MYKLLSSLAHCFISQFQKLSNRNIKCSRWKQHISESIWVLFDYDWPINLASSILPPVYQPCDNNTSILLKHDEAFNPASVLCIQNLQDHMPYRSHSRVTPVYHNVTTSSCHIHLQSGFLYLLVIIKYFSLCLWKCFLCWQ